MTQSDIILEMSRLNKMTGEEKTYFILKLHHKIENAYKILFEMEKKEELKSLNELKVLFTREREMKSLNDLLRKALESD